MCETSRKSFTAKPATPALVGKKIMHSIYAGLGEKQASIGNFYRIPLRKPYHLYTQKYVR
jgi:hypothetical protein